MANITTALASQADLGEALELANAAASVVVHKLGTTGTASISKSAGNSVSNNRARTSPPSSI